MLRPGRGRAPSATAVVGGAEAGADLPAPVVAHLMESLAREGHPVAVWAERAGIADLDPAADLRLTFAQEIRFLRAAVRALPGRPLGLETGARSLLQSFGMLGVAVQTADDLEAAIAVGLRYHQAAGSLVDFVLDTGVDEVRLTVVPRTDDEEVLPFLCEETLLSVLALLRSALGDDRWAPGTVDLPYPEPPYGGEYPARFGCAVRFDAPAGRMTVPAALLRAPLPRREPAVHAAALAACRAISADTGAAPDVDRVWAVEQLLRADLRHPLTMAGAARQLQTTERTLRRHLVDAGESFRSIHARVRREHAEHLLRTSGLSLSEVAGAVGFADVRDFRRAFVQWTGRTPGEVRGGPGSVRGAIADADGGTAVTPG
ncbi:AraC family transcriptional regulator [Tsukamurella sp. NPDC003166]|uniref:AraC family transcriptional regulator n=1 Tax=Tsukamurella sp. NPDC003166 TaxID=3154444 RepID=UPI00339DED63